MLQKTFSKETMACELQVAPDSPVNSREKARGSTHVVFRGLFARLAHARRTPPLGKRFGIGAQLIEQSFGLLPLRACSVPAS